MLRSVLQPLRFDSAKSVYSFLDKLKEKELIQNGNNINSTENLTIELDQEFLDLISHSKSIDSQAALIAWKIRQLRKEKIIDCSETTGNVKDDIYYKKVKKILIKGKIHARIDSYDLTQIFLQLGIQINTSVVSKSKTNNEYAINELAQHFLVATDGNTYLWEDIQEASNEVIKSSDQIEFLSADDELRIELALVKLIEFTVIARKPFIHNYPLAKALLNLNSKEDELLNLQPIINKFNGLPCLFPKITIEEETAEAMDVDRFMEYSSKQQYKERIFSKAVPNIALQDLISVNLKQQQQFIHHPQVSFSKQELLQFKKEHKDHELSLINTRENLKSTRERTKYKKSKAAYNKIVTANPSFAGQTIDHIKQQRNQRWKDIDTKIIWLKRLKKMSPYGMFAGLVLLSSIIAMTLYIASAVVLFPVLGPLSFLPGLGVGALALIVIGIVCGIYFEPLVDKINQSIDDKIERYAAERNQCKKAVQKCNNYLRKNNTHILVPPAKNPALIEAKAKLKEIKTLQQEVEEKLSYQEETDEIAHCKKYPDPLTNSNNDHKRRIKYAGGAANSGLFAHNPNKQTDGEKNKVAKGHLLRKKRLG